MPQRTWLLWGLFHYFQLKFHYWRAIWKEKQLGVFNWQRSSGVCVIHGTKMALNPPGQLGRLKSNITLNESLKWTWHMQLKKERKRTSNFLMASQLTVTFIKFSRNHWMEIDQLTFRYINFQVILYLMTPTCKSDKVIIATSEPLVT